MVFRRWWCQPLGDIRIAIGDKVCQEFSSNFREAKPTRSTANEQRSSMNWHPSLGMKYWAKLLSTADQTSHLANKTCSTKVASASASMCFFYMPYHFTTPHKPAQTTRKPKRTILSEQISVFTSKHDPQFASQWQEPVHRDWCRETLELQPSQRGDKWRGSQANAQLKPIVVHTTKEWISEAVVGIVAFASVSSRSLDRDPSWTPCGRSSYGTCWIWPMHLSKLHEPRKRWKTS